MAGLFDWAAHRGRAMTHAGMHGTTLKQGVSRLLLALLLAGCASQNVVQDAQVMVDQQRPLEALAKLEEAVRQNPMSAEYRAALLRLRAQIVGGWLMDAQRARAAGKSDAADDAYRRVLQIEPANELAVQGLKATERERRWDAALMQAQTALDQRKPDAARALVRSVLAEAPQHARANALLQRIDQDPGKAAAPDVALAAAYRKPVSIEFKDATLKTVFEVLAKSAGLNFVFDKDVRSDQKTSIFLRNSTVEAAVNRLLLANQLAQRVLDQNSVLIYPDTPAKQKDYQLLTVKSFYLANADAKSVATTLKSILKIKDVVVDERLNLVILRDSAEAVRMAERIVALQDVAEPEVMLEVEVLEVKRSRLLDLGVRWPGQVGLTLLSSDTSGRGLTLAELRNATSANVGVLVGPTTISARADDSDANILANPRIRSKNKEKARIHIGDRVPNITSTSTSTGFVSDSVNYIDVGLKLDVEPIIYPDNEIMIKISLEVSNLVNQVQTKSGTLAYQIGTRNAATVLRLRDGENQILAGLISDEDRRTANMVPGLGRLPVAGKLFGGSTDEAVKTEIVLSITPRLLRNLQRPEASVMEFESGTDTGVRARTETVADAGGVVIAGAPTTTTSGSGALLPSPTTQQPAGTVPPGTVPSSSMAGGGAGVPSPVGSGGVGGAPLEPAPAVGDVDFRWSAVTSAKVNQSFKVDLTAEPRKAVLALPLAIGFDPAVLQVMAVEEGDFLKQGGVDTSFDQRVDPSGQVLVTAKRSGNVGASAAGRVLSITFRPKTAASATQLKLLTVAPEGLAGLGIEAVLPSPLQITVQP